MNILMGIAILVASAWGFAEWWAIFVNRLYSFKIDHQKLRWARRLHDIFVPLFPVFLLYTTGFGKNGLLTGARFSDLSSELQLLLLLTGLGILPLTAGILRWQLWHRHAFAASDSRERFDLHALSKTDSSLGDIQGPRKTLMKRLPLNEIFHLEFNRKTIRVKEDMGGMGIRGVMGEEGGGAGIGGRKPLRIVHISDLHFVGCPGEGFYRWMFQRIADLKPDMVAFTGDLIDDESLIPLVTDILKSLPEIVPCFFVLGNHDWRYDHARLRNAVQNIGWHDLAGQTRHLRIAGYDIVIAGTEMPWLGHAPSGVQKSEVDLRLLLSHSPDQFQFAIQEGFDVMLAGHTHGGQVVLPIVGPVFSPSWYGVRFASGLFRVGNLNLHVSRGAGSKDPLRWRCCPEVTCLEVQIPAEQKA